MSVLSHLTTTASKAVLSSIENGSIVSSISTLTTRLNSWFGDGITEDFKFGSYTRDTILPRAIDEHSDVDYMVVFKDTISKPQTYLDRLKKFAVERYGKSEIFQSHPTVVLQLSHIKFELVPAIPTFGGYQIPAPASNWQDWISTYPNSFNAVLTSANTSHGYNVKPMVRLIKYWNASAGYVFDSFGLEQYLVNNLLTQPSLKEYTFRAFDSLQVNWDAAQWRKDQLSRAKKIIEDTRQFERDGMPATAEAELKKLLPSI